MRRPIVLCGFLWLAGCGASNAGGTPNLGATVAFEDRCRAWAEAEVDREVRCWRVPSEHRAAHRRYWTAANHVPYHCGPNPEVDALLARRAVRYDGGDAAAAIAELNLLPCHVDPATIQQLRNRVLALEGQLPEGAPCTESLACRDGHCPAWVCGRTCTPLPGPGEACVADALRRCASGLACVDGTCVEPGGVGDPCDDAEACAPGLACVTGSPGPGRCVARVGPDEACDDLHRCQPGLWCSGRRCAAQTLLPPGEPCGGERDTRCVPHAECLGGVCRAYLLEGEACAPDDPLARCYPWGAACDEPSGTCRIRPWAGDPCEPGVPARACLGDLAVCEGGACALPAVAVPAVGDACGDDDDCGDDLICAGGACAEGCR